MLKFNSSEAALTVKNNNVTQVGTTVLKKIILIYLPKVAGDEKTMAFAGKLKSALEKAAASGVQVHVSMSGERNNEITVMSITSCFPARVVDNLAFYKEKYDFLTMSASESITRENRVILHIEGTGADYPNLFLAAEKQKSQLREEYTPYVIIAAAMGLIKYADREDGTGKSAYGTVTVNRMGREVLNPISDKFSSIGFSETFTEDFCEELKNSVIEKMQGDYLNVTKRKELLPVIQELVGKTILAECGGNSGTTEYRGFEKAGEAAMDILEI